MRGWAYQYRVVRDRFGYTRREALHQRWAFIADPWTTDWLDNFWQKLGCFIFSHVPIRDQCNKPEHDYCAWCGKWMPNGADA